MSSRTISARWGSISTLRPATGEPPTARCLIFVTPDAQRTMNTFLGASQFLPAAALDEEAIGGARILYLEGYLWDPEEPRAAMRHAIETARKAGREVAFTLSDAFVISRHGDDFRQLIDEGLIDILFANHVELAALTGEDDFDAGIDMLEDKVPVLVVTRSEKGAVAVSGGERAEVAAEPITKWSTPPARATCSPPGSSTATSTANRSNAASGAGRLLRPRSSATMARARKPTLLR